MKNILVTGGTGYIGSLLVEQLSRFKQELGIETIVTAAIQPPKVALPNTIYEYLDVRDKTIYTLLQKYKIDCVVHLATIVTPGKKSNRELEYSVDVEGTKNVLEACVANHVQRIIVTSSGAAYGYHPENSNLLTEDSPLRGNYEFAYSHHKRLVELELEKFRKSNPQLEQVIFRIGTVLGVNVNNQISDLFKKSYLIGVMGSKSPFNFILDTDVAKCLLQAITNPVVGIFNLAGDGYLTIDDFSQMLKKPKILLPPFLIQNILAVLKKLGLTQYGPEQVRFLQYRPVLDNSKLKSVFGFKPQMTSKEVFEYFMKNNLKL